MSRFLVAAALLLLSCAARAEDREFLRALDDAQRARPALLTSTARIAPETEPGAPLIVHGRVFAADGRTPLAGAVVFAYHTDRTGLYDRRGAPPHSWRLRGWAKTDAEGRFEFRTIRPAPYPGGKVAAHIHIVLYSPDGARDASGGVLFSDDPLVGEADREATRRDETFGPVRSVRREGTGDAVVQHVDLNLRAGVGKGK